jgi:glycosyltransferase involved in cell wall biosynthesis
MARLLFVSECFPLPMNNGQKIRVFNLVSACARRFDVTFVGPPPVDAEGLEWIQSVCAKAYFVDAAAQMRLRPAQYVEAARALRTVPRRGTMKYVVPYMGELSKITTEDYQVIFAVRLTLGRLFKRNHEKLFVDLDDITHLRVLRQLKVEKFPPAKVVSFVRFLGEEIVGARRYLGVSICSDDDRRYLRKWGLRNVIVVPNAPIVLGAPPQREPLRSESPRLVFIGNMASDANTDAVVWFATRILPLLRHRFAGLMLNVVGPNVPQELADKLSDTVQFCGFVDDLAASLSGYDIAVAPLRFGGGTKLKVLDAVAAGVPLVTTPIGAEGIGLVPDVHASVASSAEDFAEAITMLADDPDKAAATAQRARQLVESTFSWPGIQQRLADWLAAAVSSQQAPPMVARR